MSLNGKICAKCRVELQPKKNGVSVIEMASLGPYAIWQADLWQCPDCGAQAILGIGMNPMAHHHDKEHFDATLKYAKANSWCYEVWMTPAERDEHESILGVDVEEPASHPALGGCAGFRGAQ